MFGPAASDQNAPFSSILPSGSGTTPCREGKKRPGCYPRKRPDGLMRGMNCYICAQGLIFTSRLWVFFCLFIIFRKQLKVPSTLLLLETTLKPLQFYILDLKASYRTSPERWQALRSRPCNSSPIRLTTSGPGALLPLHSEADKGN